MAVSRAHEVAVHRVDLAPLGRGQARGHERLAEHLAAEGATVRRRHRRAREDVVVGARLGIREGKHLGEVWRRDLCRLGVLRRVSHTPQSMSQPW